MENQEIDDEKSKNIKILIDKVAKLEQDVLNLSMHQREEVKQDNNCDAQIKQLREYIDSQISQLSASLRQPLQ